MRTRESGQSAVEFAASLPLLMLITAVGVDLGSMLYTTHRLSGAMREGARLATESSTEDGLEEAAVTHTQRALTDAGLDWRDEALQIDSNLISVPNPDASRKTNFWYLEINSSYQVNPLFAALLNAGTPQVRSQAAGFLEERLEGPVSEWGGNRPGGAGSSRPNTSKVEDEAGNNDGYMYNGARLLNNDRFGSVLHFDGVNDTVLMPASVDYKLPNTGGAFMMWLNFASTRGRTAVGGRGTSGNQFAGYNYGFYADNSCYGSGCSSTQFQLKAELGGGSGSYQTFDVPVIISPNNWYHTVMTWDATKVYVYINGQLAASRTRTSQITYETIWPYQMQPLELARWRGYFGSNYFGGDMADVRIYDSALSAADVQSIYEGKA